MANLGTLRTYIGNWMNRSDLNTEIDLMVNIVIRRLENDPAWNWKYMDTKATGSLARLDYTLAFPDNYKSTKIFFLIDTDSALRQLDMKSLSYVYEQFPYREDYQYTPNMMAVDDANNVLVLRPTVDQAYTYEWHYQKFSDELTADADTNWMVTNQYELVLYGALVEASLFIKDLESAATWEAKYTSAKTRLRNSQILQNIEGSQLSITVDNVV
jgi:hypothetical protein